MSKVNKIIIAIIAQLFCITCVWMAGATTRTDISNLFIFYLIGFVEPIIIVLI